LQLLTHGEQDGFGLVVFGGGQRALDLLGELLDVEGVSRPELADTRRLDPNLVTSARKIKPESAT
jgi:hypothetical protein